MIRNRIIKNFLLLVLSLLMLGFSTYTWFSIDTVSNIDYQ